MKVDEDEKFPSGTAAFWRGGRQRYATRAGVHRSFGPEGPQDDIGVKEKQMLGAEGPSDSARLGGAKAPLFHGGSEGQSTPQKKGQGGKRKRHGLAVPFLRRRTRPCDVGPGLRKP